MINLSRSKLLITFRRNLGSRKSYLGPLLVWTELNMQESYRVSQSEYIYIAVFVVCTPNLKPSNTTSLRPKLTHFCEWLNRLVTLAHVKLKIRHKCSLTAGGTLDDSICWLSPSPPRQSDRESFPSNSSCATWREIGLEWLAPILLVLKPLLITSALSPSVFLTFHDHLPPQKIFNTHKLFFLSGLVDQSVGKRRSTPEVLSFNHTLVRAFFYPYVTPIPSMSIPNVHIDIGKYATVLLPLLNELVYFLLGRPSFPCLAARNLVQEQRQMLSPHFSGGQSIQFKTL